MNTQEEWIATLIVAHKEWQAAVDAQRSWEIEAVAARRKEREAEQHLNEAHKTWNDLCNNFAAWLLKQ